MRIGSLRNKKWSGQPDWPCGSVWPQGTLLPTETWASHCQCHTGSSLPPLPQAEDIGGSAEGQCSCHPWPNHGIWSLFVPLARNCVCVCMYVFIFCFVFVSVFNIFGLCFYILAFCIACCNRLSFITIACCNRLSFITSFYSSFLSSSCFALAYSSGVSAALLLAMHALFCLFLSAASWWDSNLLFWPYMFMLYPVPDGVYIHQQSRFFDLLMLYLILWNAISANDSDALNCFIATFVSLYIPAAFRNYVYNLTLLYSR